MVQRLPLPVTHQGLYTISGGVFKILYRCVCGGGETTVEEFQGEAKLSCLVTTCISRGVKVRQ